MDKKVWGRKWKHESEEEEKVIVEWEEIYKNKNIKGKEKERNDKVKKRKVKNWTE